MALAGTTGAARRRRARLAVVEAAGAAVGSPWSRSSRRGAARSTTSEHAPGAHSLVAPIAGLAWRCAQRWGVDTRRSRGARRRPAGLGGLELGYGASC